MMWSTYHPKIILRTENAELTIVLLSPDLFPQLQICTQKLGTKPSADSTTLDHLDIPSTGPIFIKIDVDGAEGDVLIGGAQLLLRPDVTLLIETHSLELETQCRTLLESLGYQCQIIRNAWWRFLIPENRPIGHNRWLGASRPA
jgi:hypothetical protein